MRESDDRRAADSFPLSLTYNPAASCGGVDQRAEGCDRHPCSNQETNGLIRFFTGQAEAGESPRGSRKRFAVGETCAATTSG